MPRMGSLGRRIAYQFLRAKCVLGRTYGFRLNNPNLVNADVEPSMRKRALSSATPRGSQLREYLTVNPYIDCRRSDCELVEGQVRRPGLPARLPHKGR
jgi:hypothetical protein